MAIVYIGAGSNLGNRFDYLDYAREELSESLSDFRSSSLYETAPRDYYDQGLFLNCVFSGKTSLSSLDFLMYLQSLEEKAGRIREGAIPKGPRTLDLDILLWDSQKINLTQLIIPHPAMKERAFVLFPLLELETDSREPGTGVAYRTYLDSLADQGVKRVDFSRWMC